MRWNNSTYFSDRIQRAQQREKIQFLSPFLFTWNKAVSLFVFSLHLYVLLFYWDALQELTWMRIEMILPPSSLFCNSSRELSSVFRRIGAKRKGLFCRVVITDMNPPEQQEKMIAKEVCYFLSCTSTLTLPTGSWAFFSVKHSHRDIMMIITPHFLRILVLAQHAAHRVLTTDLTFYVKGILIADINRDRLRSLHGEKKETGSYCFAQKLVG